MQSYLGAIILYIIIIAAIVGVGVAAVMASRETPLKLSPPGVREHYGPPPGVYRALNPSELGDRGWPSWPLEYNANTASSISHMIERSA